MRRNAGVYVRGKVRHADHKTIVLHGWHRVLMNTEGEAKAMRKENAAMVFTAGLVIAAFVSIPIVNLATPLFGMAFMVHMHKRLSGPRPELIEPARRREMSAR